MGRKIQLNHPKALQFPQDYITKVTSLRYRLTVINQSPYFFLRNPLLKVDIFVLYSPFLVCIINPTRTP
jgi:hypothetical protein